MFVLYCGWHQMILTFDYLREDSPLGNKIIFLLKSVQNSHWNQWEFPIQILFGCCAVSPDIWKPELLGWEITCVLAEECCSPSREGSHTSSQRSYCITWPYAEVDVRPSSHSRTPGSLNLIQIIVIMDCCPLYAASHSLGIPGLCYWAPSV